MGDDLDSVGEMSAPRPPLRSDRAMKNELTAEVIRVSFGDRDADPASASLQPGK